MEKQKVLYEEKALVALQRATQEKTEAAGKAATLQVKGIKGAGTCWLHVSLSRTDYLVGPHA